MAARREQSRLPAGKTLADFASPARIRSALGSDSAIRAEYSRQRSIIRKRVERMAAAGETSNPFFAKFGDLATAMPTAKGLSTEEMTRRMAASARAISGSYASTLEGVKEQRQRNAERMAKQARKAGDKETAEYLESGKLTAKQDAKIGRVWKIIRAVMGDTIAYAGTGDTDRMITEAVVSQKQSALGIAAQIMTKLDADLGQLEQANKQFTREGKVRVAWAKAHPKKAGKRGGKKK